MTTRGVGIPPKGLSEGLLLEFHTDTNWETETGEIYYMQTLFVFSACNSRFMTTKISAEKATYLIASLGPSLDLAP